MTAEEDWLAHETLTANEWKAVQELAYKSPLEFEILANLKIGEILIRRLVALGLVERGAPPSAYMARGYDTGYRLTPLGWKARERGQDPKR